MQSQPFCTLGWLSPTFWGAPGAGETLGELTLGLTIGNKGLGEALLGALGLAGLGQGRGSGAGRGRSQALLVTPARGDQGWGPQVPLAVSALPVAPGPGRPHLRPGDAPCPARPWPSPAEARLCPPSSDSGDERQKWKKKKRSSSRDRHRKDRRKQRSRSRGRSSGSSPERGRDRAARSRERRRRRDGSKSSVSSVSSPSPPRPRGREEPGQQLSLQERLRLREEKKKQAALLKALETPEEKRARRLAKKEAKERKKREKNGLDSHHLELRGCSCLGMSRAGIWCSWNSGAHQAPPSAHILLVLKMGIAQSVLRIRTSRSI